MSMSSSCQARLDTCAPELVRLFRAIAEDFGVVIVQGERTEEQQAHNVAIGVSRTQHSKHLLRPSQAVDAAPSPLDWNDKERFIRFAEEIVLPKAKELGIPIRWGGAWNGTRNGPGVLDDLDHFELHHVQDVA